ncbi:MAG: hypothetical protein Kow00121_04500 [Elainellaceae cyanobacterium]
MPEPLTQTPYVSVIIPVFNDADALKICLSALSHQTYPKDCYEVIVVDNGSKDKEPIAQVVSQFRQVSIAYEHQPGSYAARNKGISLAKGDILAFTDADCVPTAGWLEHGVQQFLETPNCGMIAGKVELFFKDSKKPTAVELYESIELDFPQDKLLEVEHFGVTANLFTSKEILNDIGPFNATLKSGGDREWGNRVFEAGYKQIYAEKASVKHPARYSWAQLYKRITRINGGLFDLKKSKLSSTELTKSLAKDLVLAFTPPFRSLFRIWADQRLVTPEQKLQFISAMLFVRYISAWERIRLKLGGQSRRW